MRIFHFGHVTAGADGSWGQYALHLQCPWRLDGPAGVVTGQGDLWEHATLDLPPAGWSYEQGDNLQDARLGALLVGRDARTRSWANNTPGFLVVTDVEATEHGDLIVALSGGYKLRVWPDSSRGEAWRFFVPQTDAPHFVFRDDGDSAAPLDA